MNIQKQSELYRTYKENDGPMTWNEFQHTNKISNRYCTNIEDVENYEKAKADNFKGWHLHHRLETHNSDGNLRIVSLSRKELIALDMYYNRPANELIYLTKADHSALHAHFTDKNAKKISKTIKLLWQDPEYRQHMSEAHKGHTFNRGRVHSKESRQHMSEAHKGNHSKPRVYYKCVETDEVSYSSDWLKRGYKAYDVAIGKRKSSKGFHFVKVDKYESR